MVRKGSSIQKAEKRLVEMRNFTSNENLIMKRNNDREFEIETGGMSDFRLITEQVSNGILLVLKKDLRFLLLSSK